MLGSPMAGHQDSHGALADELQAAERSRPTILAGAGPPNAVRAGPETPESALPPALAPRPGGTRAVEPLRLVCVELSLRLRPGDKSRRLVVLQLEKGCKPSFDDTDLSGRARAAPGRRTTLRRRPR